MAMSIFVNRRIILRCSNRFFDALHTEMEPILHEKNIKNEAVLTLIERMDQGIYGLGIGFDLDEYLFSLEDFNVFTRLVEDALKKVNMSQAGYKVLEVFKNNLLVYMNFLRTNESIQDNLFYCLPFWIKGNNILECTNLCLRKFTDWLQELLVKNHLEHDEIFREIISRLLISKEQPFFVSIGIEDLFDHKKKELLTFIDLVDDICIKAEKDTELSVEDTKALHDFRDHLIFYLGGDSTEH